MEVKEPIKNEIDAPRTVCYDRNEENCIRRTRNNDVEKKNIGKEVEHKVKSMQNNNNNNNNKQTKNIRWLCAL